MITDELLFRFLSGETSKRQNRSIETWLEVSPDHRARLNALNDSMEFISPENSHEEALADWNALEPKLSAATPVIHLQPRWLIRIAGAAAIFLFLAGSGLLWQSRLNTHIIRNNEQFTRSVYLPDGTHVDLGPDSKLVYGKDFLAGNRVIRLSGEAFFEVTSDPDHPFIVEAGVAKIKVTGTRFTVNAPNSSKEVEVSVKSGKVLFYNSEILNENSFRMGLAAGEKGIFYPSLKRMDKTTDPYYRSTP